MDEQRSLLADERLFTRDLDGHLLRMDSPTHDMLDDAWVSMTVDGQDFNVPRAVPLTDSEGGILYDEKGRPIPRLTTILDAALVRHAPAPNPVPILCHREHMTPAAVCRVCVVQVARRDKKTGATGRPDPKLVPACHQPVVDGMVVETIAAREIKDGREVMTSGAKRVEATVKTLVEMLTADHLHVGAHPANELEALAARLGVVPGKFGRHARYDPPVPPQPDPDPNPDPTARHPGRMLDASSPWFVVDRTACILCDRCIRGCGEVRGHFVLARAGKGAAARIAFDWDQGMGGSDCVRCGECFISCPTDAITMRPGVKPSPWDFEEVDAREPAAHTPFGWLSRFFSPGRRRP